MLAIRTDKYSRARTVFINARARARAITPGYRQQSAAVDPAVAVDLGRSVGVQSISEAHRRIGPPGHVQTNNARSRVSRTSVRYKTHAHARVRARPRTQTHKLWAAINQKHTRACRLRPTVGARALRRACFQIDVYSLRSECINYRVIYCNPYGLDATATRAPGVSKLLSAQTLARTHACPHATNTLRGCSNLFGSRARTHTQTRTRSA